MVNVLPQVVKPKRMTRDLLFPQWYVGCRKFGSFIFYSCRRALTYMAAPLCPKFGNPRPSGTLCADCVGWQAKIDGICSLFQFGGVISQAIHQLKYIDLEALAMHLAMLLKDYMVTNLIPWEVLVPVPLHRKRLRERGHSQSYLIARELAKLIKLPVMDGYLIQKQYNPPQTQTMTMDERWSNVADAFTYRDHRLKDKQTLLIDDASTSGATPDTCATSLKSTGFTSV